ncbi:MAG: fatty acid desaturase [Sphingorhabdus sp.]
MISKTADNSIVLAPEDDMPVPGFMPGIMVGGPYARSYRREYITLSATKWVAGGGALIWMAIYGSGWVEWSAFVTFYVLNMLGIAIGYHRLFAHRAFKTSQPMEYLFGIMAQMAAIGSLVKWAVDHRRHHRHTDRPGDAHSPLYDSHGNPQTGWRAFYMSHFGWVLDDTYTVHEAYGKGLLDSPAAQYCHRTRWLWFIVSIFVLPALWGLAFAATWQQLVGTILIGGGLRSLLVLHALLSLSSIGHLYGSQNFKGTQNSRNNFFLALLTLGEGWHNNHHHHANSAHFKMRWYEIDMSGSLILLLEKIGLVWDVQLAPKYRVSSEGELVFKSKTTA